MHIELMMMMMNRTLIQEIEWKILEAERNGDVKQADTLLGDLERDHPGLLATRLHCEVRGCENRIIIRRWLRSC